VLASFFQEIWLGRKTFEVRRSDRSFAAGDVLELREWSPFIGEFTRRTVTIPVIYVMHGGQFGIEEGYCVLALDVAARRLSP
jgi:hypothetical protein